MLSFAVSNDHIMKRDKIIYWITTGIIAAAMLLSAYFYLSGSEALLKSFASIGLPVYLVMLLGTAKLIGAVLLLAPVAARFKEWTYAGFLFTFGGAVWAHVATSTPWFAPFIFLMILAVSYIYWNKLRRTAV